MKLIYSLKLIPNWMLWIAIVVLFTLVGSMTLNAQKSTTDEELDKEIQVFLEAQIVKHKIPGISVAVQIPGEEPWLVTSGYSDPSQELLMETDMVFNIASYTKAIIGTLTFQLIDQGLITIDDSLTQWLPDFRYIDNTITIKQLLGHTSGIYNYTENNLYAASLGDSLSRIWTPEELLDKLVNPPIFDPGARCQYSNTNYILLGMIIKEATQLSISKLLHYNIFAPLGMTNTCFPVEDAIPSNFVHGWEDLIGGDNILDDMYPFDQEAIWSMVWTCSAIFSNTADMNTFMNALFIQKTLISQESLDQMQTLAPSSTAYGHGIYKCVSSDQTGWGHVGNYIGFSSCIFHFPEKGINITILINRRNVDIIGIRDQILEMTLKYISTSIFEEETSLSGSLVLEQNYPNPFNFNTEISFMLPKDDKVSISIYNTSGQLMKTLVNNQNFQAGQHTVSWNGSGNHGETLKPGIYFYQMRTEKESKTIRCLKIE